MFTDDTESRTAARKSASILLSVVADLRNRYDYATKLWLVPQDPGSSFSETDAFLKKVGQRVYDSGWRHSPHLEHHL